MASLTERLNRDRRLDACSDRPPYAWVNFYGPPDRGTFTIYALNYFAYQPQLYSEVHLALLMEVFDKNGVPQ